IASLHEMQLDSIRAWEALSEAFETLGEKAPREEAGYVLGSLRGWLLRRAPDLKAGDRSSDRKRDEMLCALYYQAVRVAVASGKPGRLLQASLRSLAPAERLGPSAALAKSYLGYGFVLTLLGMPTAGARYLALAEDIGKELRDPIVYSHALQMHGVIAAWGGRFQDSLDAGARCLLEYGHWRELGDYIFISYSQAEIETIRGRDVEAWKWLDLAVQRVNLHEGAPVVHELLLLGARAALVGLGRELDAERLLHRLEKASVKVPKDSGLYPVTFAPRVAFHTAKMDLGDAFEAIVAEFRTLKQDPKRVHIIVVEYYVQVAYARVHAYLRCEASQRKRALAQVSSALADLKAAAKIPPFHAHAHAIEGYHHFFEGRREDALRAFSAAERLGQEETAPWVLYAVYRGRAHMLRAEGRVDAARDQAVLAESVATEHGAVYRARWVREEFGLRPRSGLGLDASYVTASLLSEGAGYDDETSAVPGGSRARRQLRALLRISQARAQDLAPDRQARLVVDELIQALRAKRGFLFLVRSVAHAAMEPSNAEGDADLELVAGRDASGRDLGDPEDLDRNAVREARIKEPADQLDRSSIHSRIGTTARLSAITAPLVVDDEIVGVAYLDRPLAEGTFSEADGEVLAALAGQVSVALELTRTLRAREHAQEHLRNAEKMDAVARLARGIAHDLNNMLSAIRLATIGMMTMPGAGEIVGEDVRTIQSALSRANELTKQLGTFSLGAFGTPQLVRLGKRVERLMPVISGLAGETVRVDTKLAPRLAPILIDPNQIDEVLMNLAVNARDAMSRGGTMTIKTSEVTPDEDYLREHPGMEPGRYVCLSLSDTGHGMDEDIRQKIFEPYFTTKRDRGGTGLGLATVYWIVSQNGGHVDVKSVVGVGTTFTLFFPRAEKDGTAERRRRSSAPRATVLVVEEDPATAREVEEAFTERGYRVVSVRTGAEALDRVRRGPDRDPDPDPDQDEEDFDLIVADVLMPGMNGLELAREVRKSMPKIGTLFVSGDTSGVLAARGILEGEVELLPKPVPAEKLVRRARAVLERNRRSPRQSRP
ncbi:MAG TPA: ATP-binding protein, partial [Polyangiaceae bacterium]